MTISLKMPSRMIFRKLSTSEMTGFDIDLETPYSHKDKFKDRRPSNTPTDTKSSNRWPEMALEYWSCDNSSLRARRKVLSRDRVHFLGETFGSIPLACNIEWLRIQPHSSLCEMLPSSTSVLSSSKCLVTNTRI